MALGKLSVIFIVSETGVAYPNSTRSSASGGTIERYNRPSLDRPHTICMQSRFPDVNDSHMSEGPDGAYIEDEQCRLDSADAGQSHLE